MRVLIQSSSFLPTPSPGAGAVEYLVAELAKGLAARGHRVMLYGLPGSDVPGVEVHIISPGPTPQATESHMAAAIKRLTSVENTVLFDHSCWSMAQSLIPSLPAVSMCHGMAPRADWARNWVFTSQHHGALQGVKDAKALHLGVDLTQIPEGTGEREDRLLWVGRVLPYKQLHVALDVAKAADIPLTVAGPVVDADYWNHEIWPRLAKPKEGRFEVKVLKEVPHDEVLALMRTHRALLFTSNEQEPAGLVMLEALASGCPVVAFDHGANREYLPHYRDEFEINSVVDMVDTIEKLVPVPGDQPRRYVAEHFSIERMVERAEGYLIRAVKGETW